MELKEKTATSKENAQKGNHAAPARITSRND